MNETAISYIVSDYETSDFYRYNLKGYPLLTKAEKNAKDTLKANCTNHIHKHTLKVVKTFKVTDKPKASTTGKHTCQFEKCSEEQIADRHKNHQGFCWKHQGLVWHTEISQVPKYDRERKMQYIAPTKIPKSKALNLLQRVVVNGLDYHESGETADRCREWLVTDLKKLGFYRTDSYRFLNSERREYEELAYLLILKGALK